MSFLNDVQSNYTIRRYPLSRLFSHFDQINLRYCKIGNGQAVSGFWWAEKKVDTALMLCQLLDFGCWVYVKSSGGVCLKVSTKVFLCVGNIKSTATKTFPPIKQPKQVFYAFFNFPSLLYTFTLLSGFLKNISPGSQSQYFDSPSFRLTFNENAVCFPVTLVSLIKILSSLPKFTISYHTLYHAWLMLLL